MPLARRLPKRGFNNKRFRTVLLSVNLAGLEERFDAGAAVDEAVMRQAGLANGKSHGIKILGKGKLTKKLDVTATRFSDAAKAAIEDAGGTCTLVTPPKEDTKSTAKKKKAPKKEAKAAGNSPSEAEPKTEVADEKPVKEQIPAEEAEPSDDQPSEKETG